MAAHLGRERRGNEFKIQKLTKKCDVHPKFKV
jgi:hypothetical protein